MATGRRGAKAEEAGGDASEETPVGTTSESASEQSSESNVSTEMTLEEQAPANLHRYTDFDLRTTVSMGEIRKVALERSYQIPTSYSVEAVIKAFLLAQEADKRVK